MHTFRLSKFCKLILTILLISSTKTFSQSKLMEGYIITADRDTVKGLIRHEGWTESPAKVKFKSATAELEKDFYPNEIREFYISGSRELYRGMKIGILDISLEQIYSTAPSLIAKDSIQIFLQEVVSGKIARLYEFVNKAEESHFFIEKDGELTELYNYPFYKEVGEKKYLLVYDEYKRQLAELTKDAVNFKSSVPGYLEKPLKRYVENYNQSFSGSTQASSSADNGLTFDLDINAGLENWHEPPLEVPHKFTYGFGVRMNLPRRFRNRSSRLDCS
jgi:hypothetical protein